MAAKWGYMLSLDLAKCRTSAIRCPYTIKEFSETLVKRIDMKAYGSPHIVRFGDGNKAGYTLVQLIETSNICAHFCEQDNAAFIDIFSCKPYQIEDAVEVVKEFFEPQKVVRHYIERSIPELQ
jgi:S-adenosylmethionine/arginine decarboxylase-like enzyme